MNSFSITVAFLMGLTGSIHCVGMCGPIVWIMPFQNFNGLQKALAMTLYHLGRISVYALAAFILHSFRDIFRPEWQQVISVVLGLLLLIAGILYFSPLRTGSYPWSNFVRTRLGYFFAAPSMISLFGAGALNGMLPCGMVYMALSGTMTADTPLAAAALMFVFGAGTIPMLSFVTLVRHKAAFLFSGRFRKMVPIALFAFGSLFVLRGMNLGIPYLSPRLSVDGGVVKASCCHKH